MKLIYANRSKVIARLKQNFHPFYVQPSMTQSRSLRFRRGERFHIRHRLQYRIYVPSSSPRFLVVSFISPFLVKKIFIMFSPFANHVWLNYLARRPKVLQSKLRNNLQLALLCQLLDSLFSICQCFQQKSQHPFPIYRWRFQLCRTVSVYSCTNNTILSCLFLQREKIFSTCIDFSLKIFYYNSVNFNLILSAIRLLLNIFCATIIIIQKIFCMSIPFAENFQIFLEGLYGLTGSC